MLRSLQVLAAAGVLCFALIPGCGHQSSDAAGTRSQTNSASATHDLAIVGMTCEGCVAAIEGTLAATAGVRSCTVDLESETAHVVTDPSMSTESVIEAVEGIGGGQYSATQRGT